MDEYAAEIATQLSHFAEMHVVNIIIGYLQYYRWWTREEGQQWQKGRGGRNESIERNWIA